MKIISVSDISAEVEREVEAVARQSVADVGRARVLYRRADRHHVLAGRSAHNVLAGGNLIGVVFADGLVSTGGAAVGKRRINVRLVPDELHRVMRVSADRVDELVKVWLVGVDFLRLSLLERDNIPRVVIEHPLERLVCEVLPRRAAVI